MTAAPDILVADDDENDLRLIALSLARGDPPPVVCYVRDGSEALDYLFERGKYQRGAAPSPAFLLLDLHMPRVDGWEVLRQVKADARLRAIPVVIFSSSAREKDVRQCYELGANAYVVKPIDFAAFQETIRSIHSFWTRCNHSPRPGPRLARHSRTPDPCSP